VSLYIIVMRIAWSIQEIRTIWSVASAWCDRFARGVPNSRGLMSWRNHIMLYLYVIFCMRCVYGPVSNNRYESTCVVHILRLLFLGFRYLLYNIIRKISYNLIVLFEIDNDDKSLYRTVLRFGGTSCELLHLRPPPKWEICIWQAMYISYRYSYTINTYIYLRPTYFTKILPHI